MFERLKRLFSSFNGNIKYKENIEIKTPYKKFMKEVIPRSNIKKKGKISKNVIEINKFKKADPNVLKLRKTVIGFQLDFNKIDLRLFFKKKGNIFATSVFVLILIVIISFSFGTRADLAKVDLYPKNCLGGWNNPNLAEGEPDTKNVDEYSKNNSAFLSNSNAEIFCAGFEGDLPDETNIPIKFSLKLAMLVTNSELPENDDEGSIPSIDSGPIEIVPSEVVPEETTPASPIEERTPTSTEDPTTTETPQVESSEPQALLNKITPLAYAQETEITFDEVTPQTNEHALLEESGQITENDFLDVVYSIDGTEWKTLGKINGKNWQDASFDFEDENIKAFADIAKIQVSLKPIASIDAQPVIYLDSMYIEVLYENMKIENPGNLPKVSIDEQKADLNIISGSQEFSLNDTPVFTISDPDLTTYEIAKLVVDGKATVIEDTDKVIEDTVLVDTNILQEVKSPDIIEPVVENLPELEINNSNIIDNVLNIFEGNETVVEPTSEAPPQPLPEGEEQNSETPQTETSTQETITNSTTETTPPPADTPEPSPDQGIISSLFFQKVYAKNGPQIVSATVVNVVGDMTDIHTNIGTTVVDGVEKSQVTIDKPERQFKPGKYTLKIILQTDNALLEVHQDFTWGVLVVNTNKSIYDAGDDAYIQMGVLDDGGHTICAAKLEMDIKTPSGALTHYSTDEGSTNLIVQDAHCGPDNFVEDGTPDYHTHFTDTTLGGQYDIKLTATTENGVKVIKDKFFVDSATAFDVERITASRIQPVNVYPVTLKVKAKNAFVGTIVERVPADFEITEPQNSLVYDNVEVVNNTKIISWNLSFTAGETKTLGYYYDAPNISPEIFLLGPLQTVIDGNKIWEESRQWQIASDAVCIAAGTGNWTTITWTNCGAGPTAADSVQIPNGFTVTLDTSPTVDSIDIQNGGGLINDGNARTLTLDGTTGTLFTLGGTGTFTPGTFITVTMNSDAAITTTSGTITFYDLNFTPTLTSSRTWTMGTSAITTTGNFIITPSAGTFYNLTVNMGADITVDPAKVLRLSVVSSASVTLDPRPSSTDYNISAGSIDLQTGATLTCASSASTITLTGTSGTLFTRVGTFTITSGTPTISVTSASGSPTLLSSSTTLYNLTINSSATVINQGAITITINNNFTLTSGVYNYAGGSFTGPGGSAGTFSLSSGTTFCLGGTTAATNATCDSGATDTVARTMPTFQTYSMDANSTVSYLSNAALTVTAIASPGYGNLNFRPIMTTTARTYTLGNGMLVQGTLISSPTSSGAAARILTVNVGTGTNTISGAVTLTGRVSAFAGSTTFAIAANTISMASVDIQTVTVASVLSFTSGTLNLTGTSGTLLTRGGTFTQSTGTVKYIGDGSATLVSNATITFYNLDLVPTLATTNRTYTFGTSAVTIASGGRFTINPTATNSSSTAILTVSMGAAITVNANATTTIKATQVSSSTVTSVLDAVSGSNWGLSTGFLVINAGGGYLAQASTITLTGTTNAATLATINTGGTFTCGTSTISVTGVTNSNIINGGTNTFTGSNKMYNLTVGAAAVTKSLGANLELDPAGTLTVSAAGTFSTSGSNFSLTVGKINQSSNNAADIILGNASTITLTATSGNLWTKAASAVFTPGTSEVIVTSASGSPTLQATSAITFHKLTINSTATVINMGALAMVINNVAGAELKVTSGVFNASGASITGPGGSNGTLTLGASGTLCLGGTTASTTADCISGASDTTTRAMPTFQTYTFDSASTVSYLSDAATTVSSTPTYGNLKFVPKFVTTSRTYTMGGALTINGNFNVTPDESGASTPALTITTAGNVTVASSKKTTLSRLNSATVMFDLRPSATDYDLSTGYLDVLTGATLDLTSDVSATAVTLTGDGSLFSGILFTLSGTFTITSGTPGFVVSGNGDATFNSGTPTFYNLSFTGTGVKSLGGNITINNNMTVSAGTFDPTASYTVTGSGTNVLTVNTATIRSMHSTFAGDYVSFETVTLNTNSTVDYYLGGTQTVDSTKSYYNLAISTSGTKSPDNATTASGTITVNGGTLDTNSCTSCALNAAQITIQGGELRPRNSNVTISGTGGHPFTYTSGTFTYGTSNIIFTGNNGAGNTAIEDAVTYYDVTVNNASETYVMEGTTTLTRTLTITLGTFDTTGSNYTLNIGKIDIASSASAIFTANDSTVTLSGTSGTLFTKGASGVFNQGTSDVHMAGNGSTITATNNQAITFYDLYIDPTITAGSAYTFGTSVLTVDNNFTINPTAASSLALTVNMGAGISVTGIMTLSKTSSATSVLDTRPVSTDYNITASILTINSGATLDCTSSASVILINSGSQTTFTNNGTFNYGLSTVYYMGNYGSGNKYIEDTDYYNLFINNATETYELTNNTAAYGAVIVEYGTLTTTGSNYSLTAGGIGVAIAGTVPATLTLNASNVFLTSDLGFFADPTYATINAGTSTIKFTDSTSSPKIFSGGGKTYNNLWFAPGAGTGDFEIRGSNTFADFKDDGTSAHTILFTESTTTTVTTFTVSGNSGQLITINSGDGAGSPSTNTHSLVKSGGGVISSDYLNIQHSVATPTTTWYAGANSTNNQGVATAGSGWYFTVPPCQTIATGNWNDGSKWTGCAGVGGIPATTDDVVVNSGHTITLNTAPTVLTVDIFGTLDTSGTNYAFNSGKLTIESGGTLTANGSTITLSGTDGSPFVNSGGTFTAGTSTFIFTGNNTGGNTTIPAQAFYNLTVNNTSETFVLAGNTTMNALGTVTVTLGTLSTTGSNFSLSAGKVVIADSASAIFTANASTITLSATSGTIFDKGSNGVFNYGTSTVVMNGNGNVRLTQDNILGVGALDFYNLSLTPTVETSNKTYTFGTITTTIHGDLNIIPDSTSGKTLTFNCDFDSGYFLGYVNVDPAKTITLDVAGSANLAYDNNSGAYVGTFSMGHIVFGSSNITVPNFNGYLTGTTGTLITTGGTGVDLTTVTLDVYLDSSTVTFSDESLSLYGTNITANTASTLTLGGDLTTSTFISLSCAGGNLDFDTAGYDLTLPVLTISGVNGNFVNFIANDSIVNIGSGGLSVDALDIFALSSGTSNFIISGPLLIYGDILFYDLNLVPDLVGGDITWATYSYPVYNAINSDTYVLATYNDFNINPENSGGSTPYVFDITTENVFGSVGDFSIGSQDAFSSAVIHVGPDGLIGGSITIGSAGEIDGGSNDITVGTNWTNNGTFTQGTSTVYFPSASNSVISGNTTFYNLTIQNTDDGLAKQIDFSTAGGAIYQVDNTFTVIGNPSQLIKLWSSASPTQWNFKPLGTASVSYADVMDGGCEVGSINIYPLTSYNSGNNDSCWVFAPTLTFSIDDPSIGFGPLSSSSARFATADTSGSNTDTTYATRMNISTTNSYGFSLTYLGDLLKSGTDDINAGNITNDADGTQGTEEFGISVAVSGGSTVTSGYDHNATPANRDWKYVANTTSQIVSDTVDVTNENIDVYYLTNASTVTPAGSYSTTITYIVTGTF